MASIHPAVLICFAAYAGLVLSLWSRRNRTYSGSLVALTGAIWGGIWLHALEGDTHFGLGLSFALLQFVPLLVYVAVQDFLTSRGSANVALHRLAVRRSVLAIGCGFVALAVTSPWHNLYLTLSDTGTVNYLPGSFAALCFSIFVAGLSIYSALAHPSRTANSTIRLVVFAAFPVAVLALGVLGAEFQLSAGDMNPAVLGCALAVAAGAWLLVRYESEDDNKMRDLVFSRMSDPVVSLDAEQRVLDCNVAFSELVGVPLTQLKGGSLSSIVSDANFQALAGTEGEEFDLRWEHGDDVVEHFGVSVITLNEEDDEGDNASVTRVLHLTENESYRHAQEALQSADQQLVQANASVDRLTYNDELTGLANQRRFVDELEREIARHQRSGLRFGVISIEADDFNLLAEQHGTPFRDRSLALIARAIEVEVRDTDLCARLEGEEFAVLAVQMKVPGLVNLAERIRKRVLKVRPHAPGGERVRMSVSCGVGIFDPKLDDLRGLLARTDRYLNEAKRSGRNQVVSGD